MSFVINPYRFAAAGGVQWDGFGSASRSSDGSTFALVPDFAHSLTNLTVMCWVKTSTGVDAFDTLMAHWNVGISQRSWIIQLNSGADNMLVGISANGSSNAKIYETTTDVVGDETWHHCAFSFSNDDLKLFVDGVESTVTKTTDNTCTSLHNSTDKISFFCRKTGSTSDNFGDLVLDGNLADCRIYDATLSAAQILSIKNGYHNATNLVGWWFGDVNSIDDLISTNDIDYNLTAYSTDGPAD